MPKKEGMGKIFTREPARAFLEEDNFKDSNAIADVLAVMPVECLMLFTLY